MIHRSGDSGDFFSTLISQLDIVLDQTEVDRALVALLDFKSSAGR
jgi:hypothetical protein